MRSSVGAPPARLTVGSIPRQLGLDKPSGRRPVVWRSGHRNVLGSKIRCSRNQAAWPRRSRGRNKVAECVQDARRASHSRAGRQAAVVASRWTTEPPITRAMTAPLPGTEAPFPSNWSACLDEDVGIQIKTVVQVTRPTAAWTWRARVGHFAMPSTGRRDVAGGLHVVVWTSFCAAGPCGSESNRHGGPCPPTRRTGHLLIRMTQGQTHPQPSTAGILRGRAPCPHMGGPCPTTAGIPQADARWLVVSWPAPESVRSLTSPVREPSGRRGQTWAHHSAIHQPPETQPGVVADDR